jgi:Zn-finger nucleic acid-binding protein
MRCTRCLNVHLTTEEFRGQIIDSCPRCQGVWLSRQDFDQLIAARSPLRRGAYAAPSQSTDRDRYYDGPSHDSSGRLRAQGRRRSWLSEIFD